MFQGTYADKSGMSRCKVCPEGKNCPRGTDFPEPCPRGMFCLQGGDTVLRGVPKPCPRGTFGSRDGLKTKSECTDCTPGRYCVNSGLSNVTGLCAAGYYCRTKASTATPSSDEQQRFGPCPPGGYYCEAGSSIYQRCPVGRYAKPGRNRLKNADECDICESGHYCAYGNQTEATGKCAPGYYCKAGSSVRKPTNGTFGGKCFTGYFCPEGSSWPRPCPAGEYNNETARASCLDCPAGFFCTINTTSPSECPAGYYCPNKTKTSTGNPCPAGTFNNLTSRTSLDDCLPCTPGSYCATKGMVYPLIIESGYHSSELIADSLSLMGCPPRAGCSEAAWLYSGSVQMCKSNIRTAIYQKFNEKI